MPRLFTFDPDDYSATFASQGWVHIPQGLTEEYHAVLAGQIGDYLRAQQLKEFAIGGKEQALYEFPDHERDCRELFEAVGAICGLDARAMVLSERHIKAYKPDANPNPGPHKDRFASEVSIGFSVSVPPGSTLVMYPEDDLGANPFNSWAEMRASLAPHESPETTLRDARAVEIHDGPRDVVMFRGSAIWHMRNNAANTTMLYLKLNTFNCDPLAEDPTTDRVRERSRELLSGAETDLDRLVPMIGRRVDHFERLFNRDWREVLGAVLWDGTHLSISEQELAALKAMDGRASLAEVARASRDAAGRALGREQWHRLVTLGIVDLTGLAETRPAAHEGAPEEVLRGAGCGEALAAV